MTETERRVAAIYETLLKVTNVGADDNLFDLGSDSLQAVQIAIAIERDFKVGLPIEIMESSGAVRDVAAWLDKSMSQPGHELGPGSSS